MYVVHFIGARQTEMERESRDAIRSWCTALDELEVGSNWSVPEVCVSVCVLSVVESVIATKQKLKHVLRAQQLRWKMWFWYFVHFVDVLYARALALTTHTYSICAVNCIFIFYYFWVFFSSLQQQVVWRLSGIKKLFNDYDYSDLVLFCSRSRSLSESWCECRLRMQFHSSAFAHNIFSFNHRHLLAADFIYGRCHRLVGAYCLLCLCRRRLSIHTQQCAF